MNWADIALFAAYLLVSAAAIWFWLYWAMPAIARWLVKPGPRPDPEDELRSAVYDLQVELGNAIRPPLEKIATWLAAHLPSQKGER